MHTEITHGACVACHIGLNVPLTESSAVAGNEWCLPYPREVHGLTLTHLSVLINAHSLIILLYDSIYTYLRPYPIGRVFGVFWFVLYRQVDCVRCKYDKSRSIYLYILY